MVKPKISSWDDLKKTREAILELGDGRTVKLRGITERERLKATQDSTETRFDKELKKDKEIVNTEEFGYRLIMAGWIEPEIPGETFEAKKEAIQDLGFATLQKIAIKINELSGISREDIEELKNFLGPAREAGNL